MFLLVQATRAATRARAQSVGACRFKPPAPEAATCTPSRVDLNLVRHLVVKDLRSLGMGGLSGSGV